MSARRAKQDLKAGVERLEHMWDDLVEKHIGEEGCWCLVHGTMRLLYCHLTAMYICTGKDAPRSMISVALGSLPHIAILFFTAFVVWTAKPSSGQCAASRFTHCLLMYTRAAFSPTLFPIGLFSWHPTLMSIAVSAAAKLCQVFSSSKLNWMPTCAFYSACITYPSFPLPCHSPPTVCSADVSSHPSLLPMVLPCPQFPTC